MEKKVEFQNAGRWITDLRKKISVDLITSKRKCKKWRFFVLQLKTDNILCSVLAITKETPPVNRKYRHNFSILALLLRIYAACFIHVWGCSSNLMHRILKIYLGPSTIANRKTCHRGKLSHIGVGWRRDGPVFL